MPYHYRHILIKLASGKTGEFTQDKIGESTDGKGGEATKLSRLIFALPAPTTPRASIPPPKLGPPRSAKQTDPAVLWLSRFAILRR
jgi:hypothetical protein